jgi:ABC-2 type transport system ATP-binding protein
MSSAGGGTAALEIKGLWKSFPGHLSVGRSQVLNGLELTVNRGETFGFVGANGAGKTTTIKIIAGLIFADRGSVSILGRPGTDPRSRQGMGFLPEQPSFYGYLSGREFVEFHARLLGMAGRRRKTEVERVLADVGMLEKAHLPLRKCSKGMLQRIGIAQAILGEPELLILDEPMSGLDPAGRRDVRDLILAQRRRGAAVFFSSHILSDAEVLCDRVGILSKGSLALEGSLTELLGRETPSWEVAVRGQVKMDQADAFQVVARQDDLLLLRVTGEHDLTTLLDHVRSSGAHVHSLVPRRQTLEERFLDVVERPEQAR